MFWRKNKSKKKGAKKGKSRLNSKRSKTFVRGKGQIFSDQYFCKLRYVQLLTASGVSSTYYQMSGNSAFDPYAGAGGTQPMGFDQLAALYQKYRIHRSDIKVRAVNQTSQPVYVTCYPLTSTSVPGGLQNDIEQRYTKYKLLTGNAAGGTTVIKNAMSTKKLYGEAVLDDVFEALTSSNPVNQWIWNVGLYSADGATNMNINLALETTYWIEFKSPVRLAGS